MDKILVPTDFSENSLHSLQIAIALGSLNNATICLLNCSLPTEGVNNNIYSGIYIHEYYDVKIKNLESLAQSVKQNGYPGDVVFEHQVDFPVHGIKNYCEDHDVDLVVMSSKGATNLLGIIIGSTASEAVIKLNCPLMLVPKTFQIPDEPRLAMIATDFKTITDQRSKNVLTFLKKKLAYQFKLVHVAESEEEPTKYDLASEQSFFDELTHETVILKDEEVNNTLISYHEKWPNSFLCLTPRHRSWFERLWTKSQSTNIALHADIPLIRLNEEAS